MSLMNESDARAPYVRFGLKPIEDRNKTLENGFYTTKDVEFAFVSPRGSKDCVEIEAEAYLKRLVDDVRAQRFKQEWLNDIRAGYKAWKEGLEVPENGTSLQNWPLLSPSQRNLLIGLHIRTVEDMSVATEETLSRIGMGGRSLKEKAIEWLRAGSEGGKQATELAALRIQLDSERAKNEKLSKALEGLQKQVDQLKK